MSKHDAVDVTGRRRSPATFTEFHRGRPSKNKACAVPPQVEETVVVTRAAGDRAHGTRICGRAQRPPREVGMDDWGWEHLALWSARRLEFPPGPLLHHQRSDRGSTVAADPAV